MVAPAFEWMFQREPPHCGYEWQIENLRYEARYHAKHILGDPPSGKTVVLARLRYRNRSVGRVARRHRRDACATHAKHVPDGGGAT